MNYFSDQELGVNSSTNENISMTVWNGIVAVFEQISARNGFSINFPEKCPDNGMICGFDSTLFEDRLKAEIPSLNVPIKRISESKNKFWDIEDVEVPVLPDKYAILDFIQFCFQHIKDASQGNYHSFFNHHHLSADVSLNNKDSFRNQINSIFDRNGIVFHLEESGEIRRKAPVSIQNAYRIKFRTDDKVTNDLLSEACELIVSAKENDRQRAIEKIWDAFERIKTHYGSDKKKSADILLDNTSKGNFPFKEVLINESKALTDIGNRFQIRHFEVEKERIKYTEHLDWLFSRMFSFINLVLVDLEKKD